MSNPTASLRARFLKVAVWLAVNDRWANVLAGLVFAAFILSGMTTTSIGIAHLAADPGAPTAVQWGMPQWIRSDEYNVSTPMWLSIMATGTEPTLSPLAAPAGLAHRFPSGGFFETVVFFPLTMLRAGTFLPEAMVFSAVWWLPVIFFVFSLPAWFARIGGTRRMGWLATLVIVFSPSVAWWSLGSVAVLGYAVAGSLLLFIAADAYHERRFAKFAIVALASGVLLASIPTVYAPWSLILNIPILLVTVVRILMTHRTWWARLVPIGVTGVIALVFAAGTFLENREGIESMVGTVYPGSRRSSSLAQPFGMLFGAPVNDAFARQDPVISNASELSASYTVCILWALLLVVAWRKLGRFRENIPLILLGTFTVIWFGWSTVNSGAVGAALPIFNLVPPYRSAQVVGFLAVLVVCLLLSKAPLGRDVRTATASGLAVAVTTGYAASLLQVEALPDMQTWRILVAAAGAGAAVFLITLFPRKLWAIVVVGVLALLPVVRTQPILFGLADLRGTAAADRMLELGAESRRDGTLWATDAPAFDSLMLATGVPSLSGFQRSGPDDAQWERLDPDREFEYAWNRGGGYIPFVFTPGAPTNITTNGFDLTVVEVDPCLLKSEFPELGHIASHVELDAPCLTAVDAVEWSGRTVHLYDVE